MTNDPLCDCTDDEVRGIYAAALPQDRARLLDRLEACVKRRRASQPLPELARDLIGPEYIPREHTDVLMGALERAVQRADRGQDTKLIISMPPGSGKSSIASVLFPLWLLLNRPNWEIGLVSAEASLATKFSEDVRDAYDERGMNPWTGGVTDWKLDVDGRQGGILARGIKGGMSGRRLKVAIIDDPIRHMEDAYSEKIRDTAWRIYRSVIKPRMRPGSIILSIATRWHDDDLNGRLLREEGWEHVVFPALAEKDDTLGRKPGEPLLSVQQEETPAEAAERWEQTRREVGSAIFNALYQQHPGSAGGDVFHLNWWKYYHPGQQPAADQVITAWDLTFKGEATSDWCVGQAWQRTGNRYYLLDQVRFRGGFTVQIAEMRAFIARFPQAIAHVVEDAANGAAAIETLRRDLDGIVPVPPKGPKAVRIMSVSPLVEAGQVELPSGMPWMDGFLTECTAFPTAPHDDIPDTMAHALRRLRASDVGVVEVMTDRPRLPQ
jgi:predicted phage terminase large subunit-like protein